LILRHQLAVLQRRQPRRPNLNWADRALLATLLCVIPKARRQGLRLLVTPDTILRWHRDIVRRRRSVRSIRGKTGRPATRRNIRALVLRLARENPEWAHRAKFMIRDRGSNFTAAFDAVLADAGFRTVLCNVRTPRMNAIAERWIGGCRRELLNRTLVWNQSHLRRILREYETHHNQHRPHRSLGGAAPLKPLPEPIDLKQHRVLMQTRIGGLINEYRLVA
jgi:transposase InsO family protein